MIFLEVSSGALELGWECRGTAGGGDGTSGSRWCSRRRCDVASDTSTMAGPSGMEQRGLAAGHLLMDERRMATLSGIVVASTAARPGKVDASVQL